MFQTVNLALWFLALGNMLAVIFYRQDIQIKNEYVARSLCYSFTRPMWCISLAWITYACLNGYGGKIYRFFHYFPDKVFSIDYYEPSHLFFFLQILNCK